MPFVNACIEDARFFWYTLIIYGFEAGMNWRMAYEKTDEGDFD